MGGSLPMPTAGKCQAPTRGTCLPPVQGYETDGDKFIAIT